METPVKDVNMRLMKLLEDTFTEKDLYEIAMYITSSLYVGEATQASILGRKETVENLPPHAIEVMYKYDNALVDNDFFLKNFAVLKSVTVLDKIKMMSIINLSTLAEEKDDSRAYTAVRDLMMSKFDSLILLAFLWKGNDFAIDFTCKLHLIMELTPELKEYFEGNTE